jgi:Ca2+-transporting ATPase
MVLLDSNFETIISAVEEGRNIFENMRKVVAYLLSDAFDILIITVGAVLLGLPIPLLPLQILYINFIADGLPDLSLAFEKPEHDLMLDSPKKKDYPLLDREVTSMIVTIGIIVSIFLLGTYLYLLNQGMDLNQLRTLIFTLLGVDSLLYVFSVRSFRKPVWRQNIFENRLLIYSVLFGFLSMVAAVYFHPLQLILDTVSLPIEAWILVGIIAILNIAIIESIKHYFIVRENK